MRVEGRRGFEGLVEAPAARRATTERQHHLHPRPCACVGLLCASPAHPPPTAHRLLGYQLSAVLRATVPRVHSMVVEEGLTYDSLAAQLLLPLLTSTLPMHTMALVMEQFLVEVGWPRPPVLRWGVPCVGKPRTSLCPLPSCIVFRVRVTSSCLLGWL